MRKIMLMGALIGLASPAAASDVLDGVECRIEESRGNGDAARLVAAARVPSATRAEWDFSVRSFTRGGDSSTRQSGGGELPAGRWVLLGEVHTYYSTGYEATLDLTSSVGEAHCRKVGR